MNDIQQPPEVLLSVRHLKKEFPQRTGLFRRSWKKAVDGVSFDVPEGKTLTLVGESGSGKTTVGLMILDLLAPTAGEILYRGQNVRRRRGPEWLALRREMQVVFQDPYSSLNAHPRITPMLANFIRVYSRYSRIKRRIPT
jgi:ABC-type oligopeptide transport system ATPase subunit